MRKIRNMNMFDVSKEIEKKKIEYVCRGVDKQSCLIVTINN